MNLPQDSTLRHWTNHVKGKMLFYRLSAARILRVLRHPVRKEAGIVPKTNVVMQRNDTAKRKEEIWVMVQNVNHKTSNMKPLIIISAWRYPGVSKPGVAVPMPDGLMDEVRQVMQSLN